MKVLIIEDEHKIANSIKKGLEQESIIVDVAYDGESGFDLASSEDYDVIILDLNLPKISGMEICFKLRKEEDVHTPILMLTARGGVEDRVKGLNSGADDYVVKPFSFFELLARIKALGRRPKNQVDNVLKLDDLKIDTSSFKVTRFDKEIILSKKEYALLEYMMRHKGKVLTKDQIINNVWNYDADVLPNTVEVYIGYLRNKIDKPFINKQKLVHTVRGFGYKLGE
jgi:DNA-binding response OmpR family regulator